MPPPAVSLVHLQTAILEGGARNSVLAANIRRRMTGLLPLQDADDLLFTEPAALY